MLRRLIAFATVIALAALCGGSIAQDAAKKKRVALVIGIDRYTKLEPLKNPVRDATAFAELLRQHGFDVTLLENPDRDTFERELKVFRRKVAGADTAVLLYSGHGMEVTDKGNAYDVIAPADAEIDCDQEEHFRTIKLDELVGYTRGATNQIVFIDACRNIAFKNCRRVRGDGLRGGGFRGFKPVPAKGEKLLVTYATGQRAFADDGPAGEHSPFAKVLLDELKSNPTINFHPLMFRIAGRVGAATNYRQMPQTVPEGGIPEVCLAGAGCSNAVEDVEGQRRMVRALAANADQQLERGYPVEAMLLALEALSDLKTGQNLPHDVDAERALFNAFSDRRERATVMGRSLALSSDSKLIATAVDKIAIAVWDLSTGAKRATLEGHTDGITAAAFSPDSKLIVTASEDGTAQLWDANSGTKRRLLKGHGGRVWNARFSPDGKSVATASDDGTARLWDVASGAERREFSAPNAGEYHEGEVYTADFSPDGKLLATGSFDRKTRLWDTATGALRATLKGQGAVFSPDGKLAATSDGGRSTIWDVATGAVRVGLNGIEAAFSSDGKILATHQTSTGTARIWDAGTFAERLALRNNRRANISRIALSPDRRLVALGYDDGATDLCETATGSECTSLKGQNGSIYPTFSRDGRTIVTGSQAGTVRVWDVSPGGVLATFAGGRAVLSADARLIATVAPDTTVQVWDVGSGARHTSLGAHARGVAASALSPDAKLIVTVAHDYVVRLWDTSNGAVRAKLDGLLDRAVFSPNGKVVAARYLDNTTGLFDAAAGNVRARLKGSHAAFSADSSLIYTGSWNTAWLYDVATGTPRTTLKSQSGAFLQAAFSLDGSLIATSISDGMLRLWDTDTGVDRGSIRVRDVLGLSFARDGKQIVIVSHDGTAWLWDVGSAAARVIRRSDGLNRIDQVSFSNGGKMVATASSSNAVVKLWDTATGRDRAAYRGYGAVFSSGGQLLAVSAASDGSLTQLMSLFPTTQDLVDAAKASVPRCLTKEQRAQFGLPPDPPRWCIEMKKWPY
jgi:WD40 repeat protein